MTYYSWTAIRPLISDDMMKMNASITITQKDGTTRTIEGSMSNLDFIGKNHDQYACVLDISKHSFDPTIHVTLTDIDLLEDAELCTENEFINIFDVPAIGKGIIIDVTDKSLAFNPINIDIYDVNALDYYVINKLTVERDSSNIRLVSTYNIVAHMIKMPDDDDLLDNPNADLFVRVINSRIYAEGKKTTVVSPKTGKKYVLTQLIKVD